jgi:hypothetical protein
MQDTPQPAPDNLGVVGPDLAPDLAWVGGEGEQLGAGGIEVFGGVGVLFGQRGYDAIELGVHGLGVGLVEDGADLGGDMGLGGLGDLGEQVTQVVDV